MKCPESEDISDVRDALRDISDEDLLRFLRTNVQAWWPTIQDDDVHILVRCGEFFSYDLPSSLSEIRRPLARNQRF